MTADHVGVGVDAAVEAAELKDHLGGRFGFALGAVPADFTRGR